MDEPDIIQHETTYGKATAKALFDCVWKDNSERLRELAYGKATANLLVR